MPSLQLTKHLGCIGIILCNTDPSTNAFLLKDIDYPSYNKTISFLIANRAPGVFYFLLFVYITAHDFPLFISFILPELAFFILIETKFVISK